MSLFLAFLNKLLLTTSMNSFEGSVLHSSYITEADRECFDRSKKFAKEGAGCVIL